ncbi:MAG: sugar ABC transporter permease [Candidatus Izemoplasmatales bacterium]|nr:sugar ABC transporter permease [Candidatus Izemoplasmatales bacterium]
MAETKLKNLPKFKKIDWSLMPESLKRLRSDHTSTVLLLAPYVLLFTLFIVIPVLVAMGLSFTYFNVIEAPKFAEFYGLYNYIMIITQDEVFLRYVLPNTLKYAIITGPGGYLLSFVMAWMLSQIQATPRKILALALYTPSMLGGVFIGVIFRTLFSGDKSGYINAILLKFGLVTTPLDFLQSGDYLMNIMIFVTLWSSMGIGFLSMLAGILNVNKETYEAAYIDGIKNRFQEIFYITIPSMKPQMLFGAVMAIVGAFNAGGIGVALAGSNPTPQYSGQLIVNHIDDYGFIRYEMGYAAALSVILLLIILLFSRIAYRLFGEKD